MFKFYLFEILRWARTSNARRSQFSLKPICIRRQSSFEGEGRLIRQLENTNTACMQVLGGVANLVTYSNSRVQTATEKC